LWRQAALVAVIALVVVAVVQAATRPVRELSARLASRAPTDLAPVGATDAPRELQPLVTATNALIGQLAQVLSHQKRFVRDTSHQLRTPLAVLRAQLQSAQRGDLPPQQALAEMATTVDRATELANQMLALAKVEQLKRQDDAGTADWSAIARSVALDLAPLIADKALDFTVDTEPAPLRAHEWALRELTRNLLHNAVKHSPHGAPLLLQLSARADVARIRVADAGPGIDAAQRERLFQPFAHRHQSATSGSGLGLAICHEIVLSLGGRIALDNRTPTSQSPGGLDAVVELPLAAPARAAGAGASQNV
jgi:two-component system, OmpR family, sensor histidine kinase TctE